MDFAVVPTIAFKILYIFLIIDHGRRKIVHFAVTQFPNAEWAKQQIRNATFFDQPKHLIHDNDPVFKSSLFQQFLLDIQVKSKNISPRSPWQNGICERLIGTVRRELFDHIIPWNQRHLEKLLKDYVYYYNNVRTHQFIDCKTPILKFVPPPKTKVKNTVLSAKPILGGLYHKYEKAA